MIQQTLHEPKDDEPGEPGELSFPRGSGAVEVAKSKEASRDELRNFVVLALYQILLRIGWIFKAESIVIPAVLDTLTGGGPVGGFLRGCLPVLNRLGHSVPPVLASGHLKRLPHKCRAMILTTLVMTLVFGILAGMWWMNVAGDSPWLTAMFLVSYLIFFAATGINNVALSTLQGKLIQVARRGRLLLVSNVLGAAAAIAAALILMPHWLSRDGGNFAAMFGFTAFCFALAAGSMCLLKEPADNHQEAGRGMRHLFGSAFIVLGQDAHFRRLVIVGMCFSSSLILFPHYQALARSPRMNLSFDNLMIWVVVQNAGTAIFSLAVGPLADRRGNRLVMRLILLVIAGMPALAIGLSYAGHWGTLAYPVIFFLVGLTPIGFKILNNYTLEMSPPEHHTKYLSTLALCLAVPLVFAPPLGWLVEATDFELVFFAVSGLVGYGCLLTFTLDEPRKRGVPTALIP